MEIIVAATMFLGLLLALVFVIPQFFKPSVAKTESSNSNSKKISKVYDITSYVEEHPGGDAILTNAGGDSTEGFYGPQHGTRVFDLIEDFCIGELVE